MSCAMVSVTATAIKSPEMFHYNPTSTAAYTICRWMGCYSPQLDFLLHMYTNIPNTIYICLQLKYVVNQIYFTQYYLLLWHITLISFTWCHVRFTQGLAASQPPYMGGCILLSCTATLMDKGKNKKAKTREIQYYQWSQSNRSLTSDTPLLWLTKWGQIHQEFWMAV